MTASQWAAISARRSAGAGWVNVGLPVRRTAWPRSRRSRSSSSRNTSPRGLEMSSSAIVAAPRRHPGAERAAARRAPPRRSDRGSSPPRGHAPRHRLGAQLATDPATVQHDETPGVPCRRGRAGSGRARRARRARSAWPPRPRRSRAAPRERSQPACASTPPRSGPTTSRTPEYQSRAGPTVAHTSSGVRAARSAIVRGASTAITVTPVSSAATPRLLGQAGPRRVGRRSAKAAPSFPGCPWVARSSCCGRAAADVADDQLERAADRGVGAVALPERVARAVHSDGSRPSGRDTTTIGPAAKVVATTPSSAEGRVAGGLDRGEHDREHRRRAAGHDRVDRDLLDGRAAVVGRNHGHEVLRVAGGGVEHLDDALGRGRDKRQPVGEATVVQGLHHVLELSDLELARAQAAARARRSRRQPRRHARIARHARAAGSPRGQPLEVERHAGALRERRQPCPVEALHAVALIDAVEEHEGRHRLGVKARRELEVRVEVEGCRQPEAGDLIGRLGLRGLRHDPHGRAERAGAVQRGKDLVADRAVVLDERDQLHVPILAAHARARTGTGVYSRPGSPPMPTPATQAPAGARPLTSFSAGAGCGCKLPAGTLLALLVRALPRQRPAGAGRLRRLVTTPPWCCLRDDLALVQTVDFFTPDRRRSRTTSGGSPRPTRSRTSTRWAASR